MVGDPKEQNIHLPLQDETDDGERSSLVVRFRVGDGIRFLL